MQLHDTLQMLAVLKPDQRVCVMLVHAFGWTYAEAWRACVLRWPSTPCWCALATT